MDNNPNQPNNTDVPNDNPAVGGPVAPSSTPSQTTPESTSSSISSGTPPPPASSSIDEPPIVASSSDGKKPMGMMIGALVVLIIVFLGLLFFFVFNKPSEPEQPTQQLPVEDLQPSPTSAATPTPELSEDVVDDIDIGSPEAELSPIEEDLDEL